MLQLCDAEFIRFHQNVLYSKTALMRTNWERTLVQISESPKFCGKYVLGSYKTDFTCLFRQYSFILKLRLHIINYLVLLRPCLKMNLFWCVSLFCTVLLLHLASFPSAFDSICCIVDRVHKTDDGDQVLFHFWQFELCTCFFLFLVFLVPFTWTVLFSFLCSFFLGEILVSEVILILIQPVTNITRGSSRWSMKIFFCAFKDQTTLLKH
jgi:hypothetical protein